MQIEIELVSGDLLKATKDTVVVADFECTTTQKECFDMVNRETGGLVSDVIHKGYFKGSFGETFFVPLKSPHPRGVVLIGFGEHRRFTIDVIRAITGRALHFAHEIGVKELSFPLFMEKKFSSGEIARAMAEALVMADYSYGMYKTDKPESSVMKVKLVTEKHVTAELKREVENGITLGEMNTEARKLINTPASVATPEYIAKKAREVAKKYRMKCRVLDKKQMQRMKMGAVLAVGGGSNNDPRFVILEYGFSKKGTKPVVLVGKGITFDAGGLNLKGTSSMETARDDKTGAVGVLFAMAACARMKLNVNVIGLLPLAENMLGSNAYKPGDVVKTMSGKTMEILDTDAEGRVLLADALYYAKSFNPRYIVDIATLTGTCPATLGEFYGGIIGNEQPLIEKLKKAGETTHERLWQLPLSEEYKKLVESDFADLRNIITGSHAEGDTLAAAAILSFFVEGQKWAHIDIAGPSWIHYDRSYLAKGSSGVGVRLLATFLMNAASDN